MLIQFIEEFTSSRVEEVFVDAAPAWAHIHCAPERVINYATALGLPAPSTRQWAALTPLQRFALFKLTRSGHSNDNFVPAMREFGLLDSSL